MNNYDLNLFTGEPTNSLLGAIILGSWGSQANGEIIDRNPTACNTMAVDPFEVRMRFTLQLQHLSASVTSSQKAAQYALKYRDLDEDLHSCILEQLERVSTVPWT
jgi:hypothetical protein